MNVVIVAFCVNIATVNAIDGGLDFAKFIKILLNRRNMGSDRFGTNETEVTLPLMPGFFLAKPKELSLDQFTYPDKHLHSMYNGKDDTIKKDVVDENVLKNVLNGEGNNMEKSIEKAAALRTFGDKYAKTEEEIESNVDNRNKLRAMLLKTIKNGNYLKYGKENSDENRLNRVNSDSRNDNLMSSILNAFRNRNNLQAKNKHRSPSIIVIETRPSSKKSRATIKIEDILNGRLHEDQSAETENDASEILDEDDESSLDSDDDFFSTYFYRRSSRRGSKKNRKRKTRSEEYTSSSNSADSKSGSTENEKNPGNPYTIHKNKYKQNWLWNHYMDGDHMNINPMGPQFANQGPSGSDIFFGRKWWYFNQDDYKPMG